MAVFNLLDQLTFYGAYHQNKINIFIHTLCVPTILATALASVSYFGPIIPNIIPIPLDSIPKPLSSIVLSQYANLGVFGAILYSVFYIILDPFVGTLAALPILPTSIWGTTYVASQGINGVKNLLIIHVLCWIAQFIGHGFFEHRAPALLDNLVQALLLAPLFVFYEVLFAFGFNPPLKSKLSVAIKEKMKSIDPQSTKNTKNIKKNY